MCFCLAKKKKRFKKTKNLLGKVAGQCGRQSVGESSREILVDRTPEIPDRRYEEKFLFKNLFNLSHRAFTKH